MKTNQDTDNQPIEQETAACEHPGTPPDTDIVADESFGEPDNSADKTDWQDKFLRLQAEFDNYRKRTLREKLELVSAGGEEVIKPLLAVMDDFDRALGAMQSAGDVASVKQGVELIRQKLIDTLRARGLNEIEAVGQPLDTDLHEAITLLPVEDVSRKGTVVEVVQKGYKLNDKVLRHSKVVVGE